jgi:hypothetical protein
VVEREDVHAAIEARRELGQELEPQLIDSFVERIERRIGDLERPRKAAQRDSSRDDHTLALTIVSMCVAIPLSAIGVTQAGLAGLLIVWAGIVLVNLAYALRR